MKLGILGGGQLARFVGQAATRLNIDPIFILEQNESSRPIEGIGPQVRFNNASQNFDQPDLLEGLEIATAEKELIDPEMLAQLPRNIQLSPQKGALDLLANRFTEKTLLVDLGIDTADFQHLESNDQLHDLAAAFDYHCVIKTDRGGYDGKNQWHIKSKADLEKVDFDFAKAPAIVEQMIPFEREVSFIASADREGNIAFFPATENLHRGGILITSVSPAPRLSNQLQQQGEGYVRKLVECLGYVGTLGMECFVCGERLIVNELAPRVHNSGHWTMNGCNVSQFENHVRAVMGMPVITPEVTQKHAMVNLIGQTPRDPLPDTGNQQTYLYNKEPNPGRKLGHINLVRQNAEQLDEALQQTLAYAYPNSQ